MLTKAEKKTDKISKMSRYLLTCNFSGSGLYPRRAVLSIEEYDNLYKQADEMIAAMKAVDPSKQAILVQFDTQLGGADFGGTLILPLSLRNYRIVDESSAMGIPLDPADPKQVLVELAVREILGWPRPWAFPSASV